VTPGASSSGSVVRILVSKDEEVKEYVSGSEVYELLLRNGCVGEDGRFIWKNGANIADDSMSEEIQNFLFDDQETLACQQKIHLEGAEMDIAGLETALPDEILPSFDKSDKEEEENTENQGKTRKRKVWGPVQATRQSSSVDRSMNVMKKAIEYKKRNNLEEPNKKMKGIMQSNTFQSLDVDYLESLARNVGIDISSISASGRVEENLAVQYRIHSSNEISYMSKLVDFEIPRENSPLESQYAKLLPSNGVLAITPKNRNRECADNYEDE
jgi:hypothetical protein